MISAFRVAACSSVCLSIFALAPLAQSQTYQGRELVKAELLADTNAVVPGKPFTVGLLLRMAPHWHTYWQYSGDFGLPTEIKWELPAGYSAGAVQWPLPNRMVDGGNIITFGYSDGVMLLTEITPPPGATDFPEIKVSSEGGQWDPKLITAEGNLNGGGPVLKVRTTMGNIYIRRAQ